MSSAGPGAAAAPLSRKQRLMAALAAGEGGPAAAGAPASPSPALCCFICGGGISRGKELKLQVRPPRDHRPFFPFLQHQEPAPGARAVSAEGCALVCAVCRCFLGEQWDSFERSRTPVEKRMYWLKRPHQCEAAPGGTGLRRGAPGWDPAAAPGRREDEEEEEEEEEEEDEGPAAGSELSELSDAEPLSEAEGPGGTGRAPPAAGGKRGPPCCSSEDSEINITSEEEEEEEEEEEGEEEEEEGQRPAWAAGTACYICGSPLAPGGQHRVHVQKQERSSPAPFFPFLWLHSPPPGAQPLSPAGSTLVCPCCFASLMQQWQSFELANVPVLQRLYVVPLNATAAAAVAPKGRRGPKEDGASVPTAPEACYLCGEECGKEARPVAAKITNGNAKSTMHFPFLSLLPCPPGAKGLNKHWEVSSCRKCYGVLQDLWAMYRACHNEELIASVQSFLGRYHQVFSAGEPGGLAGHPGGKPGPGSVCYICGAELGAGKEFQLNVNPPGRFGEKEPFFPFLTVYPPAPRARPADSTGLVATCVLCYHDLLGQWLQHEGRNSQHPSSAWSRQYKVETFVCFFCRQEKKRCLGLKAVQVARLPVFLYTLRVANSLLVDDGKQLTIGACADCGAVVLAGKSVAPPELLAAAPPALLPKAAPPSLETPVAKPATAEPRHRPLGTKESPGAAPDPGLERSQRTALDAEGADAGATRSSISSESSPVSSPATNHSSPASTPKRGPMGPIIVPPGGHSVPSTPPVVTIAPTKTVNGVWRSEGRQQEAGSRGSSSSSSRERLISEPPLAQEKAGGGPSVPSHLLGTPYSFGLPPSSVVQDSRFPPLNLQRPVHHVVPPSAVTEDYLRSFRPYHTAEELRMSSLPPLGLDPATAAAYYHPSYLTHHPFPHPAFRMDDSYCLSALRSPFYPLPAPGSLPPLHPSAMHLHLSGVRYPAELSHSSLSALQSERISSLAAERLQMDEELRQREREREREREKEREREADREREKEREREREREKELEREREKERERELERQRERAREKELSMVKAMEGPFLPMAELHGLRGHPAEERGKAAEPLVPGRAEKLKDSVLPTPKPIQHPLHPPPASHHPVPSLIPNHNVFPLPGSSAATALLIHRTNEEEKWLARQRRLRQEKEDRQSQVSEFRQQVLEQHLDMGRTPSQPEPEHRPENPRSGPSRHEPSVREPGQHFGGPPPLISPKPQHHPITTSLWNPVSLMESPPDPPRRLPEPHALHGHPAPFEPSRQGIPLVKVERVFCPEKLEDGARKREALEKYPPPREPGAPEHGGFAHAPFLAELEKSTQSILSQQRPPLAPAAPFRRGRQAQLALQSPPAPRPGPHVHLRRVRAAAPQAGQQARPGGAPAEGGP
uniref:Gse1 coiled-coil protein n=1 Tax=Anas platyrhynchos TaxID=8839 RepID=A0A8B9TAQ5_ANAPL